MRGADGCRRLSHTRLAVPSAKVQWFSILVHNVYSLYAEIFNEIVFELNL